MSALYNFSVKWWIVAVAYAPVVLLVPLRAAAPLPQMIKADFVHSSGTARFVELAFLFLLSLMRVHIIYP